MTKKKIEEGKGKQERLKDAAVSSAWTEAIKPELEEALGTLSDIMITLAIETDTSRNYTAGEVFIGRRLASAYIQDVINQIDTNTINAFIEIYNILNRGRNCI